MKKISLIAVCMMLAACSGDSKENLGLDTSAPDEFAVERKPKLDVPPDFKLRPPTPGSENNGGLDSTRDLAREQLTGIKLEETTSPDQGMLDKFGTNKADPNIRNVLSKEYPDVNDQSTLQKINAVTDKTANKTLVDPEREKERIDKDKAENKPITTGDTPTMSENQNETILEKFFDIF